MVKVFADTTVVNIHTTEYDVLIDRTSPFGNPHHLKRETDRASVLEQFRVYFHRRVERDPEFQRRVLELRGKRLGCHCAPKPCHGAVIAEYIDSYFEQQAELRKAVKPIDFSSRTVKS